MDLAAGTHVDLIKGKTWWTSVWPLFVVSFVMSMIASAIGLNGLIGVGGLGAVVLGSLLSSSFAKRPVYTVSEAFKRALLIGSVFHVIVGAIFMWGPAVYELERLGHATGEATLIALRLVAVQVAIQLPVLSLTWAVVIVHKARRLVRASITAPVPPAPASGPPVVT